MKTIEKLRQLDSESILIGHISSVLAWDQETYMPINGINERSDQLAFLEELSHKKITNPEIGQLLDEAGSSSMEPYGAESFSFIDRAYLRILRRKYDQAIKLPASLVSEMAKITSFSQSAWQEARKNDDFKLWSPHLSKMIELSRNYASCIDPDSNTYDVLLDKHEEGSSEAEIKTVFSELKAELVKLLDKILGSNQLDNSRLFGFCPIETQKKLSLLMMEKLDNDSNSSRLDCSAHPFTISLGESDTRITSRYDCNYFPSGLFTTLHETGHCLYELGIDPAPGYKRTSLGNSSSAGIHESQSRFWENVIGRSMAFWLKNYSGIKDILTTILDEVKLEYFYSAINKVEPSFIRVEADEVTYALHIILRFELESSLLNGSLSVKDLPEAWNDGMLKLMGIKPDNDREGCLQDIHWAMGLFGYFPSYALGNLYAAQMWDSMKNQGLNPEEVVAKGDLSVILSWLRANVHKPGAIYKPNELIRKISGKELDPVCFTKYLKEKYSILYNFS